MKLYNMNANCEINASMKYVVFSRRVDFKFFFCLSWVGYCISFFVKISSFLKKFDRISFVK